MTANDLIAKVKNLTPVSQAALRLVSLLDQPSIGNEHIVDILRFDNVLTAKLLRACNSSYFGFEEQISSVEQAVLLLGHDQILHLVLSLAFSSTMMTPIPGCAAEGEELWRHSLVTALASEVVALDHLTLDVDPPIAFTAGLLHDIGKLVMNHVLTEDFQFVIRNRVTQGNISRSEAEKEVIGTDHAEVGACLLKSWRLPDDIVEAVAHHHAPVSKPKPRLSALIHTSNCLARVVGSTPGWESFAALMNPEVVTVLALTPERFEAMVASVQDSLGQADQLANVA